MAREEECLPLELETLNAALQKSDTLLNVMGVVVDWLPPGPTRGSDQMCTFSLYDRSLTGLNPRVKVKYFHPQMDGLPPTNAVGDVILLRMAKLKYWNGSPLLLSNPSTEWIVFPERQIPHKMPKRAPELRYVARETTSAPTAEEQSYAVLLCNTQERSRERQTGPHQEVQRIKASPAATPLREKFSLLQNIEPARFYDLVGQVVKTFASDGDKYQLYVTDYTENPNLFSYDDDPILENADHEDSATRREHKWPGPFGRKTLQVTLWEPHASEARRRVREQDVVFMSNVRVKVRRDSPLFEGVLHTDMRYADKINIAVVKDKEDKRAQELLARRKAYWEQRTINRQRKERGKERDLAKASKSRKRRKGNRGGQKVSTENDEDSDEGPSKPLKNRYVFCSHDRIHLSTLSSIVGRTHETTAPGGGMTCIPFQNIKYRANVRIVDFFPPKLEDFSVLDQPSEDSSDKPDGKWEWRFCLLLEDGKKIPRVSSVSETPTRLKAFLANEDASQLLGLDAEDLRARDDVLLKLKEKLFVLWGDLEETKSAKSERALRVVEPNETEIPTNSKDSEHSSRSFECCIKEYGVLVGDTPDAHWERRYRMFGTKIL